MTTTPRIALFFGAALFSLAACQSNEQAGSAAQSPEAARQSVATFLTNASTFGQEEVTFSRLAQTKGANPAVRNFATSMIADQTTLNDQLAAMVQTRQIAPPSDMDARHAVLYHQLQSLNGRPFDQAYMESQMQDRTMTIQAFQAQADSGTDPQVRSFAQQQLPALMQSLQTAHMLADGL